MEPVTRVARSRSTAPQSHAFGMQLVQISRTRISFSLLLFGGKRRELACSGTALFKAPWTKTSYINHERFAWRIENIRVKKLVPPCETLLPPLGMVLGDFLGRRQMDSLFTLPVSKKPQSTKIAYKSLPVQRVHPRYSGLWSDMRCPGGLLG